MAINKTIQHKRSSVSGNKPSAAQVAVGELAINFADKSIYTQDGAGNIIELARGTLASATAPATPNAGDIWYDTVNNQLKVYDGSTWGATLTGSSSVDILSDVDTTGATNGQTLTWNGTNWVPTSTYTHPSHPGDDINIDTGALTGALVISDLDFNVTTDNLGHVTDANAVVATRNLTAADIGAITQNETITLTGDVSGSGRTSIAVTVANDSHTHDVRYYTKTEADARYLLESNNLSDLTSASTARSNLGLGSLATLNQVDSAEIATGSIDSSHISTSAVGSSEIAANAVGASEINVTGNGTAGQVLTSDGDGSMSWSNAGNWFSTWAPATKAEAVWHQMANDGCVHIAVDATVYYTVDIGNSTAVYNSFGYKAAAANGSMASAAIPLAAGQFYRVTSTFSGTVGTIYEQRLAP